MSLLRWMCVLALASFVGACGDDSGSEDGEDVPMPVMEEVSADEGAVIDTEGAEIDIPGGALSEDTEVTVEVILPTGQPDADKLASLIYDFGPDGTTFEMPVELTIELNKSVPEGMEAQMAWLDEDAEKWTPLADSRVVGETVVATTTHFTKFAIVLTATMGQTAGSCEDFDDFEACGGDDLAGTWQFSLGCADLTLADIFGEDNEIAMCDGVSLSIDVDLSGSATFEEGGAYETDVTRDFAFNINIPLTCLPAGATCSALMGDDEDSPTVTEEDGVCKLAMDPDAVMETEMGTYELEGNTLIMTEEGGEADEPSEYCIEGNTITVRSIDIDEETGAESVFFFQATRQ